MGDRRCLTLLGLNALGPSTIACAVERHQARNGLSPALELQAPIERGTETLAVLRGELRDSVALLAVGPASL